jgi:putative membrane protein
MKTFTLMITASLIACGPALAQSAAEKTGVNSTLGIAPKTSDFVTEAATGDMFEIASSKLAASKTDGQVQAFAREMVTDHTKTSEELTPAAQQLNVPLPSEMTSAQTGMLDKLRNLSGKDFSKQYLDDQVGAHKDAVSLFQRYSKNGDNPGLQAWANKTLPTLQHHLDMAEQLDK